MRHRVPHLPEKADQCLGCACENVENLAAQELLLASGSLSVRGVIAALYIGGAGYGQFVSLAREAIAEQREWCDRNGAFKPAVCARYVPDVPTPAGETPQLWAEEAE